MTTNNFDWPTSVKNLFQKLVLGAKYKFVLGELHVLTAKILKVVKVVCI